MAESIYPRSDSQSASALNSSKTSLTYPANDRIAALSPVVSFLSQSGGTELEAVHFLPNYVPNLQEERHACSFVHQGKLTKDQWSAVVCRYHLVIVACPGSGKSTVLVRKADYLLRSELNAKVVVVSFTRDSVRSMRRSLGKAIRNTEKQRLDCSTIHGQSKKQLENGGYKYEIIKGKVVDQYLRRALEVAGLPAQIFDQAKKEVEAARRQIDPVASDTINTLVSAFEQLMDDEGVIDFSGMTRKAVQLMRLGKLAPVDCTNLFCDEVQDIDMVQLLWMLEHARHGVTITVVGDDDQSVYAFRGSLGSKGLRALRSLLGDCKVVILVENFRSLQKINYHAGLLIRHNGERITKPVQSFRKEAGVVKVLRFANNDEESEAIARAIYNRYVDHDGLVTNMGDNEVAVLARNNYLLDLVAIRLEGYGIPFVRRSDSMWDEGPVCFAISFLSKLFGLKKSGYTSTLHFMGVPQTAIKWLQRQCGSGLNGIGAITEETIRQHQEPWTASRIVSFARMVAHCRNLIATGDDLSMVKYAFQCFSKIIQLGAEKDEASKRELQAKLKLLAAASGILEQTRKGEIRVRLKKIICNGNTSEPKANAVKLFTFHASKGLEFDIVFMIGADQEIIPNPDASDEELPSERRLFYVGMTRAKYHLYISHSTTCSQFIDEAGL